MSNFEDFIHGMNDMMPHPLLRGLVYFVLYLAFAATFFTALALVGIPLSIFNPD